MEVTVPTYAYACTACDHRFEAFQAFTEDALTACPECTGRLRKLFNSVGVVFKGSGFYRTDSRAGSTGSEPAAATSSSTSSSSTTSSSSSSTTSTPAKSTSAPAKPAPVS